MKTHHKKHATANADPCTRMSAQGATGAELHSITSGQSNGNASVAKKCARQSAK